MADCRIAEPGEFTRRAFANGRLDLAEAEGLADLLQAETELQRQQAIAKADGSLSAQVQRWRAEILGLSAVVEAALDFSDEEDGEVLPLSFPSQIEALASELTEWLERPGVERLREGVRVAIAGPPNSGKSTLFNALVEDNAAITSPVAGTTRDAIERTIAIGGVPFVLVDTAGLRDVTDDPIEYQGITMSRDQMDRADVILWLGPENEGPANAIQVESRIDKTDHVMKVAPDVRISAIEGTGMRELQECLLKMAQEILPKPGQIALNQRQGKLVQISSACLSRVLQTEDPLIQAEELRVARTAFDRILGVASTEEMLDTLFGRLCIGK